MNDLKKVFPLCCIALLHLSINAAMAQDANLLANCEKLYQLNKFPEAKAALGQLLIKEPKSATAHYLLGNVYVRMQQKTEALIEYSSAIQCDKSGSVAAYARAGINALTAEDGASAPKPSASSAAGTQRDAERQNLTRSVQSVSQEVDKKNLTGSMEYQARMKQIEQDGEIESKRLQAELDEKRSQFQVERYRNTANGSVPVFDRSTQEQSRQLEAEYRLKQQALVANQRKRVWEAQNDFNSRQAASESAAVGIDSSYAAGQTGNVKLMPMGTTLYNRNYQTFGDPSGSPIPVSAPPAKSLNHH